MNEPHIAILNITAQIRKMLPSGEVSNAVAMPTQKFIFGIDAESKEQCIKQLEQCIEEIRAWSRKSS